MIQITWLFWPSESGQKTCLKVNLDKACNLCNLHRGFQPFRMTSCDILQRAVDKDLEPKPLTQPFHKDLLWTSLGSLDCRAIKALTISKRQASLSSVSNCNLSKGSSLRLRERKVKALAVWGPKMKIRKKLAKVTKNWLSSSKLRAWS